MPRKKNPNNNYFHEGVEQAILDYNKADTSLEKNKLFITIYPALCKVAEVMYNKIKPTYVEGDPLEIQNDCIVFMHDKLPMIREGKGKAFSYMTVTARNYYIQLNMKAYKTVKKVLNFSNLSDDFDIMDVPSDRPFQIEANVALYENFLIYMESNFEKIFTSKRNKEFGIALLEKLKGFDLQKDINRRNILNDLWKESGVDRHNITKYLSIVVSHYNVFKESFTLTGKIPEFIDKTELTLSDKKFIDANFKSHCKHNGSNGIARKLGVNEYIVREYVKQHHTLHHLAQTQL